MNTEMLVVSREFYDQSHQLWGCSRVDNYHWLDVIFTVKYCNVRSLPCTQSFCGVFTIRGVTLLSLQPQLSHWYLWCDVMLLTLGHKSPSKSSRPLSGVTTVWSVGLLGVWVCLSTDSRLKIVTNHTTGHSPYPGLQDGSTRQTPGRPETTCGCWWCWLLPPQNTLVKAMCGPVLNNKHD